MAIDIDGKVFRTIDDDINLRGQKIRSAYVNDTLVYPDVYGFGAAVVKWSDESERELRLFSVRSGTTKSYVIGTYSYSYVASMSFNPSPWLRIIDSSNGFVIRDCNHDEGLKDLKSFFVHATIKLNFNTSDIENYNRFTDNAKYQLAYARTRVHSGYRILARDDAVKASIMSGLPLDFFAVRMEERYTVISTYQEYRGIYFESDEIEYVVDGWNSALGYLVAPWPPLRTLGVPEYVLKFPPLSKVDYRNFETYDETLGQNHITDHNPPLSSYLVD